MHPLGLLSPKSLIYQQAQRGLKRLKRPSKALKIPRPKDGLAGSTPASGTITVIVISYDGLMLVVRHPERQYGGGYTVKSPLG